MNAKNLTVRSFNPLLERAGLPTRVRVRDLRHTCTTLLLGKGVHPQDRAGTARPRHHRHNPGHTYSHVLPNMQGEAVTAMEGALA